MSINKQKNDAIKKYETQEAFHVAEIPRGEMFQVNQSNKTLFKNFEKCV